jgi:thioredoxin-related protein
MKMKRILAYTIAMYLPLLNFAQQENRGIQWVNELSWAQVKEKAKRENKFIFVDAFATWCGPCKTMDKEVYTNDTIGDLFNARFISVRVQMDKTKRDNQLVQNWYSDALALQKQYRIIGYPTFIFFSPEGTIVHKELGYQSVNEMISLAQTATQPGRVFVDPFAKYDQLVLEYNQGKKDYKEMPYMIETAYKIGEPDFGKQLLNEHTEYVSTLTPADRYTKQNIELWSVYLLGSDKKRFWFFYKVRKIIDRVMNKKGYAEAVVDKTIQHEVVTPFFRTQSGGAVMKEGMIALIPGK